MIIRNARTIRYCRTLPHGNLPRDHKDLYSRQNAIGSDAPDHNEFPPRKLLVSGWEQIFLPLSWMDLTMDFHGFPSSFMDFHQVSWFFHQFPHFVSVWWPPKQSKAENSAARNLQRVQALMPLSGQVVFFGFRSAVPFPRVWWLMDPWMMSKIGDPRNVKGWWDEAAGSFLRTQNNIENFRIALLDALFMTWKANSLHVKWLPKTCQPVLVFYWKHTHTQLFISCSPAQVTSNPARTAPGKSGNLTIKQSCGFLLAHNIGYHKIIHI